MNTLRLLFFHSHCESNCCHSGTVKKSAKDYRRLYPGQACVRYYDRLRFFFITAQQAYVTHREIPRGQGAVISHGHMDHSLPG